MCVCVWFLGCFSAASIYALVWEQRRERENRECGEKPSKLSHNSPGFESAIHHGATLSLHKKASNASKIYNSYRFWQPKWPCSFYIYLSKSKQKAVSNRRERENTKKVYQEYVSSICILYYNHIKTTQKKTTKLFWQQYHTNMAISPFYFIFCLSIRFLYIKKIYTRIIIIHIFFSFQIAFSISNTTCYRMSGPGGLLLHMTIKPPPSAMSIIYPQEGGGGAPAWL